MPTTKKIGDKGEKRACNFLIEQGYLILEKNYRYKRAEIDIIAKKGDLIAFIEVKYRKNIDFGNPEDFVGEKKEELILMAADEYTYQNKWDRAIRFDIIAITGREIEHFEDAFG